jgi:ABC-type branched-subunit amino acid transport system substrate-binding protein
MKPIGPLLGRRKLLVSFGALALARPSLALACHERDHPPCHAAALVSVTGPVSSVYAQAADGIRAMDEQLQETDPQSRGHLGIVIVDSGGHPDAAVTALRRLIAEGPAPAAVIVADALPPALLEQLGSQLKLPMITVVSSASGAASEWVFRLSPNATQIANAMLRYLAGLPEQRTLPVNIVSAATLAPRVADFVNVFEAAGKRVDVRVTTDPFALDAGALEPRISGAVKNSGWIISAPFQGALEIARAIRRLQGDAPILVDAGNADPAAILRPLEAQNVAVISAFAPDLAGRPLVGPIAERVRKSSGSDLAPAGALAATAVQVLAQAVVKAKVQGDAYGEATRVSLRESSLPGNELIVPWEGVSFDGGLQNRNARAVALGLRENRIVTLSSA